MHSLYSQGYLLTPGLSSCVPQVLGLQMCATIPGLCSAGGRSNPGLHVCQANTLPNRAMFLASPQFVFHGN